MSLNPACSFLKTGRFPRLSRALREIAGGRERLSPDTNLDEKKLEPVTSKALARHRMAPVMANGSRDSPTEEEESGSQPWAGAVLRPGITWQALVFLCSVGIMICYADRSNISTAILPMADQFGWDKSYQGFVLSAFFAGYMFTQLLGGRLADQYGGKMVLAAGVSVWSACTVATPWAAALGASSLVACRVLLGVGEGVAFPAIHSLISRGVPQKFQSTSVAAVTAASYIGTALAFGLSPAIIEDAGWEWSFYIFGSAALLWLPCWLPLDVAERTAVKARQSPLPPSGPQDEEEPLMEANGGGGPPTTSSSGEPPEDSGIRNLVRLLRKREVVAICIAQYTQSWGLYGLINWLPTFFKEFYHVEVGQLGGLTMLPYVVQGGMGAVSGVVADTLISKGFSIRRVRVALQVAGMLGPAVCLVAATSPATSGSAETGSLFITVGLGLSALTLGGVSVSHLDIAPKNAGTVFGAGNTFATLAGLLAVPINGVILDMTDSWALVFGLTALHFVVGAAIWALWAGGEKLKEDSL
eukprot:CAMPEP_0177597806 /NCGR_PEP_ID=MMETSP0419_2-20121207/11931_1 /TAXON_ID=582737 /ORGANISM="Tetraselmis sp., Strain GSL018" /LENGTH=527 /DNA_ID=CAMNT_0019090047 /DNA_START=239 /DNA_END=1822 /DNA_ORIENTATION=+